MLRCIAIHGREGAGTFRQSRYMQVCFGERKFTCGDEEEALS